MGCKGALIHLAAIVAFWSGLACLLVGGELAGAAVVLFAVATMLWLYRRGYRVDVE